MIDCSHLDEEALELTECSILAGLDARRGNEGADIGHQIAPARIEDKPIDGAVEVGIQEEGGDDEGCPDQRQGRGKALRRLQ